MNNDPCDQPAGEAAAMLRTIGTALNLGPGWESPLGIIGSGGLRSVFAVTDLAVASIGAAAMAVSLLASRGRDRVGEVRIDRALASRWFSRTIEPQGWQLPPAWDPIAGDYPTVDGWIRLHTNAAHHRRAALRALELDPQDDQVTRERVAIAVERIAGQELEDRVVAEGGCAARMRSQSEWSMQPQGRSVRAEPLLFWQRFAGGTSRTAKRAIDPARPLSGVRVLDLTRILAGPIATRFLAGCGAEVLRIDPPDWDEPTLAPEVTLGKRCARLDLRSDSGRSSFEQLLSQADVLIHGYRPGALERLGLGPTRRREIKPDLVDVCLDAYGWSGPWHARRGFDSLVQMSSGIAEAGMRGFGQSAPTPLPVQALDHATGYLLAASAVRGLILRLDEGLGSSVRASLARTALLLTEGARVPADEWVALREERAEDYETEIEITPWGQARRLIAPCTIDGVRLGWDRPARNLGSDTAAWS